VPHLAAAEVCTKRTGWYAGPALVAGSIYVDEGDVGAEQLVYRFRVAGGLVAQWCPGDRPLLLSVGPVGDLSLVPVFEKTKTTAILGAETRAMVSVPYVDVGIRLAALVEAARFYDRPDARRWEVELGPRLRVGLFTLGVDAVYWRGISASYGSDGRGFLLSVAVELSSVR